MGFGNWPFPPRSQPGTRSEPPSPDRGPRAGRSHPQINVKTLNRDFQKFISPNTLEAWCDQFRSVMWTKYAQVITLKDGQDLAKYADLALLPI